MKSFYISICTVCMNRLHHIKETLPANLEANKDYPHLEFVLLDYNSTDGLKEWIKEEMSSHILSGRLKYYRTEEPLFFDRTHSRNLISKLSKGDIISNVDADNFTGVNYAQYLNEKFNEEKKIYIVADTKKRFYFLRNAFGRFSCFRDDYISVRGMDESMKSYGSETLDFYERLEQHGLKEVVIQDTRFLKAISHTDEERIKNEFFLNNIEGIYNRYLSCERSEILFLFKDMTYEKFNIVPERIATHLPAALEEGTMEKGMWSQNGKKVFTSGNNTLFEVVENGLLQVPEKTNLFYKISDTKFKLNVAKNYSFITNNEKLIKNKNQENTRVNPISFGRGIVKYNFNSTITVS